MASTLSALSRAIARYHGAGLEPVLLQNLARLASTLGPLAPLESLWEHHEIMKVRPHGGA